MKTRLLPVIFILTALAFCVTGKGMSKANEAKDNADSTINVIAYFCKNDTMKYQRTQRKFVIQGNDTVKNELKLNEEFMIIVRDSTPNGYKMEFIPLKEEFDSTQNEEFDSNIINSLSNKFKNQRAIFTTDEYGVVKGIDNWKEIRDRLKDCIKTLMDSLYSKDLSIDSFMPRSRFEPLLLLTYSTEEGIMKAYDELSMLFSLHGSSFNIGRTVVDETEKDSCVTTVLVGYEPYDEYSFEDDYNVRGVSVQKFSVDETLNMMGGVLSLLLEDKLADKTNKIMKDSLKTGATVTTLEDFFIFYNGWPCMMRTQKIIEFGGRKEIRSDETEWTYRSWRQYGTKEDELQQTSF